MSAPHYTAVRTWAITAITQMEIDAWRSRIRASWPDVLRIQDFNRHDYAWCSNASGVSIRVEGRGRAFKQTAEAAGFSTTTTTHNTGETAMKQKQSKKLATTLSGGVFDELAEAFTRYKPEQAALYDGTPGSGSLRRRTNSSTTNSSTNNRRKRNS